MKSKRLTTILSIVLVLSLFAILVWAYDPSTTVSNSALISPAPATNYSTNLTINVTSVFRNNTLTNVEGNITNVTVNFYNASDNTLIFNITLTADDQSINQTFNYTTTSLSSILGDGAYNITINSTNATNSSAKDMLVNTTVFKSRSDYIIVDNSVPLVIFPTAGAMTAANATVDRRNYTTNQLVVFNVTVMNGSTSASGWNNVTDITTVKFNISNRTTGGEDIILVATEANASIFFSNSTNVTQLRDGNYTVYVWANDTLQNVNNSTSITFTVDTNQPDMVELITAEGANLSDYLQFQVNDSVSDKFYCDLYINDTVNVTHLNVTNATTYNFSLRSTIVNGDYNWSVQCNDTVYLQNKSWLGNFTFDNTAPTATVTCSPSSVEQDQAVLCSCTSTDLLSPVTSTAFTDTSPSTAVVGSKTTGTCTVTDQAGNTGTATGSYTVTASSGSGGGSGGSGGGTSSSVQGQLEKKTWSSILAGEKATVAVKNGVLGVTSIEFVVQKTTYGATLSVKKVDGLPSTVEAFAQKAYKTLQIIESNVEKVLSGPAVISFKVEKKWLADNNLAASQVAMHHFKDGQWVELTTTAGQDDGTYVHFTAETPGFSYFVIGQKEGAAPVPAAAGAAAPAEQTTDVTEPSAPEEVSEPSSSSTAVWVVVGLVLLALVAWAVVAMKKRR